MRQSRHGCPFMNAIDVWIAWLHTQPELDSGISRMPPAGSALILLHMNQSDRHSRLPVRDELYAVGRREAMLSLLFGVGAAVTPLLCAVGTGLRWLKLGR